MRADWIRTHDRRYALPIVLEAAISTIGNGRSFEHEPRLLPKRQLNIRLRLSVLFGVVLNGTKAGSATGG
ncbi:hypothetical protein [Pseudomonas sp. 10S4]|uniref:hypothetical protein n=1 Tax=Pseudomonas sp. 10S4 TaxID=3048583 RepID=UPI002AC9B333|nr:MULTISPECIES: hypothetical protein [unclassified Pseudomonas]MEB0222997.1 hypothetical protein [Pseudomonas sp. 5S1]MEB0293597.1 hypothetical protein [Pseudomonas sp. 10S4]WPX17297.1 hypothetical protein RHM58_25810 [Pseudomonas sp. 10S4]